MNTKERTPKNIKIYLLFVFIFSLLIVFTAGGVMAQDIEITDFEYKIERVQSGGYRIYDMVVWIYNNRGTDHEIEYIELSCSGGNGDLRQFAESELSRTTLLDKSTLDFVINGDWIISAACTEVTIDVEYGANSVKTKSFLIDIAEYYTLSREADLNFGSFSAEEIGSTVTVFANGGIDFDSTVHMGDHQAAEFKIEGPAGSSFNVQLPADGEVVIYNGSASMSLVNFETNSDGVIGNDYIEYFNVGATLEVDPLQVPGSYTGTFSVIVTLQ